MSGFKINPAGGFWITFDNSYTVSVQFAVGYYADNKNKGLISDGKINKQTESKTAECGVLSPDGGLISVRGWEDNVKGYMTPNEVLKLMLMASRKRKL